VSDRPDDIPADPAAPARPVYRDDDEFNKSLDAASASIRKAAGPDVLGNVLFWGMLLAIAVLLVGDWAFDWRVRRTLIPGVDLVKLLAVAVAGMFVVHHVSTRNHHTRILRQRLCFQCGTSLAKVSVDAAGDGTCPECARAYNLGEYRRPQQNRGRGFNGYIDGEHFDKAIFAAAEQIRKTRGTGFEADLMGWSWIALGVIFGCRVVLGWDFDWLPGSGDVPYTGILFVSLLIWGGWYTARMKRLKPSIVSERLCMNCGYCLLHTPIDDDGLGSCPECDSEFVVAQYERPPDADDAETATDEAPAG